MSTGVAGSTRLGALLAKDARGILRDRLLLFLLGYGVLLAAVVRIVVGLVPVEGLGLYVAPAAPVIGSLLVGAVLGLLLVEERESGTWLLLRVLPLTDASLTAYLFAVTAGLGLVAAAACVAVYGHPVERPLLFASALVVTALGSPVLALLLASLAPNKIQAMALGKLFNLPVAMPLLAFVVPAPWHLLLWWSPWYWIYVALLRGFAAEEALSDAPLALPGLPDALLVALPALLCGSACVVLGRRFRRVAG